MTPRNRTALLLLPILLLSAAPADAGDSSDGPVAIHQPTADLTDLFAFPSPEQPGRLTLILNVYSAVAATTQFSEHVTYTFVVKRVKPTADGAMAPFETRGGYRIACTFQASDKTAAGPLLTCRTTAGTKVRVPLGRVMESSSDSPLRVFAGRRSNPYFVNASWATAICRDGKLMPPRNVNSLAGLNVLSIVAEIDVDEELGTNETSLWAVAAETTESDWTQLEPRRFDRVGRPGVTNDWLAPHAGDDLRDDYNAETPFQVAPDTQPRYRQRLQENIDFYDRVDNEVDWNVAARNRFAETLLNDYLVVDTSKPIADHTYFEIERAWLERRPHSTCGGRVPNEDTLDVMMTLMVNRGRRAAIRDGVDRPTKLADQRFPYLASPSRGVVTSLRSFVGRAAGRLSVPGKLQFLGVLMLASGVLIASATLALIAQGLEIAYSWLRGRVRPPQVRARSLAIIAALFAAAYLTSVTSEAFSCPVSVTFLLIGIGAYQLRPKTPPPFMAELSQVETTEEERP